MSLDVGGQYAAVNINTTTGNISLNGTSASGRGVDIAPSALNAVVNIGATSGNIAINGNSTNSFGGYGIFFNSSGSSTGVNVTTVNGDITLRGDIVTPGGNQYSQNTASRIADQMDALPRHLDRIVGDSLVQIGRASCRERV